jgi:hypothetical protein
MPDLNLDLDYFTHPKTTRLIGLLGKGAEVLPIRLWCYCGKYHAEDGRLTGYSTQEIESLVGWWGDSGVLIAALLKVHFLEGCENDFVCHDWADRNGHIQALKERNRKVAQNRWEKIRAANTSGIPSGIPEPKPGIPQPTNQPSDQKATDGAGAEPEQNYPLEETLLQHWGRAGRIGHGVMIQFVDLARKHGWERVEYAIKEAAGHNACSLAYVKGILEPKEKVDEVTVGSKQDYFAFQTFLTQSGKQNGSAYTLAVVTPGKEWRFSGAGITDLYKQFKQKRF